MSEIDNLSLSILLVNAAKRAGVLPIQARRLIDELVALPGEAAWKILREREREMVRRAEAANRKVRDIESARNVRIR